MEIKDLTAILVVAMVGCILVAGFVPVFATSTTEALSVENEGTPFKLMSEAPENPAIVVSLVDGKIVIESDGEIMPDMNYALYGACTLVYGETGFIRINPAGQIRGFADNFYGVNVTDSVTVTITFSGDNVILTPSTGTAKTVPIKPTAYIGNGSYVQTVSPYILDDSVIYLAGNTNYDGVTHYISYVGFGVYDDLSTLTVYSDIGEGVTVEDLTHTVNVTHKCTNLYKLDNVQFTATDSNDRTYNATFSFIIAPAIIVYENPSYAGDGTSDIISMIPFILVAGITIFFVSAVLVRRYV